MDDRLGKPRLVVSVPQDEGRVIRHNPQSAHCMEMARAGGWLEGQADQKAPWLASCYKLAWDRLVIGSQ